jgi:L-fuculose-phosphate aldolase
MAELGLVRGSSGNVSVRYEDGILISASGIPYHELTPAQIIEIDQDGKKRSGVGAPSSEWRMHAAIYLKRGDAVAIVHTHSPYATAAAIARPFLPVVHDEGRILFGEKIPVASHALPGTWELAAAAAEALGTGKAILLADHGTVAVGQDIAQALSLAEKIEEMAELFWLSRRITEDHERTN